MRKKKELNEEYVMDQKLFLQALHNLCKEKHIDINVILEAVKQAFVSGYRKHYNTHVNVDVKVDMDTGEITVRPYREVVSEVENWDGELTLEEALELDDTLKLGDRIYGEIANINEFGRVAISTAKQVVVQRVKEAEKESITLEFGDKEGQLLLGQVTREDERNYYVDLGRVYGLLPKTELIGNEEIAMESTIKVYVAKIETSGRSPVVLLSRSHYGFLKKLLELEIPEIETGEIILKSIARDAGNRSKVAVCSTVENLEAVGTCIGEGGSRIARVLTELKGEKIDIVLYDEDPLVYIEHALAPAKIYKVIINDKDKAEANVIVDNENLSLAIGKKGLNVRLAARLTHYRINVQTLDSLCENGINE